MNMNANMDGESRISGCADGVGMVGIVADGGASIFGALDGLGTVADGGIAHMQARAFAAADVTSGFAHLPDRLPPV
jgi:hypothetical protein